MAYDICEKCQRFFERSGKSYCEECDKELNLSREKIDDYLSENPRASIMEIVKEADVKLKDVNVFLDSGGATIEYKEKTVNLGHEENNKFTPRSLGR